MSEAGLQSSKRRRLNSSSTVYQSGTVKRQRRFRPKRRSIRRVIPETPEKKRQKTLTQAQWLENGREVQSEEEEGEEEEGDEEKEGEGTLLFGDTDGPTPAVGPTVYDGQRAGNNRGPRRRRVRLIATPSDDDDFSAHGDTSRNAMERRHTSRSQSTLTQLEDFLTEDTVLSARSVTPAGSAATRRKKKDSLQRHKQRTLTQMLEVPASDDEEMAMNDAEDQDEWAVQGTGTDVELGTQDDTHSVASDAIPMASDWSPASKDALRVPDDIRHARRRALLATQITQNQDNINPNIVSPEKRRSMHSTGHVLATPQKSKRREIPSSQSPASSAITTLGTDRFYDSPVNARVREIVQETPSKSRRTQRVLFADSASGSSSGSTQIKDEPLSSANITVSSPAPQSLQMVDAVPKANQRTSTSTQVNKRTMFRNVIPPSQDEELVDESQGHNLVTMDEDSEADLGSNSNAIVGSEDGDRLSKLAQTQGSQNGSSRANPVCVSTACSKPTYGLQVQDISAACHHESELHSIDLDSPACPWHGPDPLPRLPIAEKKGMPVSENRSVQEQSQGSGSSQAEAQLHEEMKTYSQRKAGRHLKQRAMRYPSQATTIDITQATQSLVTTTVTCNSSQQVPPLSTAANSGESLARPPDLIIPSSPIQILPPPLSSPPIELVEDSQFGVDKGRRCSMAPASLGLWSLPAPPPLDSDEEEEG
ncbi:hypothetical protein EJ05DRAFT_279397 [Pseudovirgaria hyperparasitica]|uniref:Uncharacterized protein n=1 Tax=Pseudovirgaria hyperparasitica TaxID=470096 RepID=A0A6A6WGN3_9PEZI|nr:uncharacterized protein EJ05DRAFT_279397 [Pseudovirgaria hyperparasitica]KAF2760311.1 hypothetical protein EJ05DRAFT_279397 [Pseudovirgaria hyperparasitica]